MRKAHGFYIEHWMIISFLLMAYDAVSIAFSYFFGLWLGKMPVYADIFLKLLIFYKLQRFCLFFDISALKKKIALE